MEKNSGRYYPAKTATYKGRDGATYHMVSSELREHGFAEESHDTVFKAIIKRVDDFEVTTHTLWVGVDNCARCSSLLQDHDQPHVGDLFRTAMTGFTGRKADARCY